MGDGLNLSVQQWEVLGAAPALVFVMVAKSDGVISENEEDALVKDWLPRLQSLRFSPVDQEQKVYQWALGEATVNMHGLFVMSADVLAERLKASVAILDDHVPPARATSVRAGAAAARTCECLNRNSFSRWSCARDSSLFAVEPARASREGGGRAP